MEKINLKKKMYSKAEDIVQKTKTHTLPMEAIVSHDPLNSTKVVLVAPSTAGPEKH